MRYKRIRDKHGHALDQHTPERRDSHRYHDIRPLTGRGKYGERGGNDL